MQAPHSSISLSAAAKRRPRPLIYPESDGKPMAESDIHRDEMVRLIDILRQHFSASPDVYVSGNLLLYFEEGNPRASIAPDVFVIKGVAKHARRTYLLWEEGVAPSLVIEVTSPKTSRQDRTEKWERYTRLGVREYIFYDPEGVLRTGPLRGFHRIAERWQEAVADAWQPLPQDGYGRLLSSELGLGLELVDPQTGDRVQVAAAGHRRGLRLAFIDPRSGRRLLDAAERAEQEATGRLQAEAQAAIEAAGRLQAEAQAAAESAARREAEQHAREVEARLAALEGLLSQRDPPAPPD